ncbi:MAG: recombinase [Rhizobium sp.]|nr:recombinase [Rhizobium sp.]
MNTLNSLIATPLFEIAGLSVTLGGLLIAVGALAAVLCLAVILAWRSSRWAALHESGEARQRALDAETRMAEILRAQTEMQGRIAAMTDVFGARQSEMNQAINLRIDGMTHRLGQTMTEQTRSTHENLRHLQERLAVIDTAQNNIQALAKDVVGLQAILSNKQTRGAFGQSRMETIIADALPMGAYEFQATLSNGNRPDCVVRMPNGQPSLVIDAKFPLEAWNAIRDAGPEGLKTASLQFRRDIEVHIRDISDKYLIRGETQDTAFMFVPSESIFAEIHENFESVVQRAHKARIVIVSPSLLMLSIQVIQAVLKDQRMREQAHLIQGEVIRLMEDLVRLDDRVQKLQSHFSAAQRDVEQIVTSSDKLAKRGQRIEAMEFTTTEIPAPAPEIPAAIRTVESRTGQLKFRVVDED